MHRGQLQRWVQVPVAGAVVLSIGLVGVSSAQATTTAAAAYNRALSDAVAKKYVSVTGTATAANFKGHVIALSGPTFAQETSTLTYSGPPFKLVAVVVGNALYLTGTAAALTDDLNFSKANATKYQNKPLLLPATNSLYAQSVNGATLASGVSDIRMKGAVTEGKPLTYKGLLVNVFSGESVATPGSPSSPQTIYVSTTNDPLPVLVKSKSDGLNLTEIFTHWGVPFLVHAPIGAVTIQPSWTKK